ncbi:MAG TPA: DMT family transporter [Gemmatimonadaceae bacterium]|nr:DMT family transporter [Gemmatimonadaceae bacterium]
MPLPPRSTSVATAFVAVSACCFGSIPVLTLLATQAGAPLVSVLAGRYGLAAPLFLVAAGRSARQPMAATTKWQAVLILGGGQALIAGLGLSALRFIPAATASFLFYTYPAWVAIAAAARGTERLTSRRLLALALSLGGVMVMVGGPAGQMDWRGVALSVGAAVAYSLYIPFANTLQRETTPATLSMYVSLGAFVVLLIFGQLTDTLTLALSPRAIAVVIALALLTTVLAFILFLRGLAVLGPVRTAIVSTVEPFCTAVLGSLVLGQPITGGTIVGGGLIAGAVVLLQRG